MNNVQVVNHGKTLVVHSIDVARHFGKRHDHVLRDIDNLIRDSRPHSPKVGSEMFFETSFTNSRNREYRAYLMTRDGFTLLAMGFTGTKALAWKIRYIETFNRMEHELAKRTEGIEWKQAREQIRHVRRSFTDAVQQFVEYATSQGSKNAKHYYSNLTRMEYAALDMVAWNHAVPEGFRDTIDTMDLCFLATAEQVARQSLIEGMHKSMHYKEIYKLAKDRVCRYAETVCLPRVEAQEFHTHQS